MPEEEKAIYKNISEDSNFKVCEPRAEAMVYSLRAFGYDLGMAIADLIDNSIFAKAKHIQIDYAWADGNPWIRIVDDGEGMDEATLVEAMRLGTMGPLEKRDAADLGRFGLGLKTASFSQCQLMSVITKTKDGHTSSRFWDLAKVRESKKWLLGIIPKGRSQELLKPIQKLKSGTIVLWEYLDKHMDTGRSDYDPEEEFLNKFTSVKEYLETVFHQYLEAKELKIKVGIADCIAWDPYLKSNTFTQRLYQEQYEDQRVSVIPYVLPHISKRTDTEKDRGGGPKGWNAQQGFYVYRNKRMIVSGGYLNFDFKLDEHCKLARIYIDITNDMDHEWNLDVRKAIAIPPDRLREELQRIAKVTRAQAEKVYRARLGRPRTRPTGTVNNEVWARVSKGEKIIYKINRENPVIAKCIEESGISKSCTNKLFHAIESTIPHRGIIIDDRETEDCLVDIPEDLNPPPKELIAEAIGRYRQKRKEGRTHDEAADIVCAIEPFNTHIRYRTELDALEEGKSK